jgi:hypothetical protein
MKRNSLRFSFQVIPGPPKQEAALPGGGAVPNGTGWKSRVLACILFPKNSEKYFCFPYNFGLTKQGAEGILIRP